MRSLLDAVARPDLTPPQALHLTAMALFSHAQQCWLPVPPRYVHVLLSPAKLHLQDDDDALFLQQYHQQVVRMLRSKSSTGSDATDEAEKPLLEGIARLRDIATKEASATEQAPKRGISKQGRKK